MKSFFLPGVLGVIHHLVDGCRAEALAGISVFLGAGCTAHVSVGDDEVRGLVRLVLGSAESYEVLLRKRQHAVELELFLVALGERELAEAAHPRVTGMGANGVDEAAALCDQHQRDVDQHAEQSGWISLEPVKLRPSMFSSQAQLLR